MSTAFNTHQNRTRNKYVNRRDATLVLRPAITRFVDQFLLHGEKQRTVTPIYLFLHNRVNNDECHGLELQLSKVSFRLGMKEKMMDDG